MNVNLDKTKTLMFVLLQEKNVHIKCQGKDIENVKSYNYLWVTFSHLGCFNEARHNLYVKGLKGQFKLSKSFYPQPQMKKRVSTFLIIQFNYFSHMVKKYGDRFPRNTLI